MIRLSSILGALIVVLSAGCHTPMPGLPEEIPYVAPPVPLQLQHPYFSVQSRLIPYSLIGKGPVNVHVHAAIHGNEPEGIALVALMKEQLQKRPDLLRGLRIIIVPRANPDGLFRKTRFNVNGVDLNRNFPASNWKRIRNKARGSTGTAPLSEPETRALVDLMKRWPPALVITLHSKAHCVNWDGPCEDLAQEMGRINGYRVVPTIGYPTPGSLGSWMGRDKKVPVITLELYRADTSTLWKENGPALMAAIRWVARA